MKKNCPYNYSIFLLSKREYSEKKLRTKLIEKGHLEAEINECITKVKEQGYLSDERFKEARIVGLARKGKSIRDIKFKLESEGVPSNTEEIEQVIKKREVPYRDKILDKLQKKREVLERKYQDPRVIRQKMYEFSVRQGIDPNQSSEEF